MQAVQIRPEQEMLNCVQAAQRNGEPRRRGRPARIESERFKTIAWWHAVMISAGSSSPKELADLLAANCSSAPGLAIDETTLGRYRSGSSSPTTQRLGHFERVFPGTREVFESGPSGVALWSAMWGPSSKEDVRLAELAMPDGRWPSALVGFASGTEYLARVHQFRGLVDSLRPVANNLDLVVLSLAIRAFRIHAEQGQGSTVDLFMLMEGASALPGTEIGLAMHGLRSLMSAWIDARRKNCEGDAAPCFGEPTVWMKDRVAFYRMAAEVEMHRVSAAIAISSGLFERASGDVWDIGSEKETSTGSPAYD